MAIMVNVPNRQTVRLFGVDIDCVTMQQAVDRVQSWMATSDFNCHVIVTPNLDHVVRLRSDNALRGAYEHADLVVADGWPIVSSSRWFGRPLPERVTGSDLVPAILATAEIGRTLKVYLLGAMPGVGERAARQIVRQWPHVEVVGTYSPPLGFERDAAECEAILARIAAGRPDLLVVGLGAPKQEIWLDHYRPSLHCKVAIAAGATIDFLAGEQRRAPRWLQSIHLEWLYRLCRDPKRLARRYLYDAWMFPGIFWNEWRSARGSAR